jgi:hypothetical protein
MPALPNEPPPGWPAFLDEVPRAQLEQIRDAIDEWGEGEAPAVVEECRQALHDPDLDVVVLFLEDGTFHYDVHTSSTANVTVLDLGYMQTFGVPARVRQRLIDLARQRFQRLGLPELDPPRDS